jgi:outer membrane biosynthesis protein TonB
MQRVAERALAAMETVYNLAKSAADATPTPKPTPKTTEKPKAAEKPKATPKPARTPSCDDRLYENKRKMIAAFETFHTNNDKLYYAIKRRATEATVKTVLENDKLMHSTYESAKTEILSSGCAGDLGAAAAARAAATFERAWLSSAAAAGSDRR